jgi:hypothetical protein
MLKIKLEISFNQIKKVKMIVQTKAIISIFEKTIFIDNYPILMLSK